MLKNKLYLFDKWLSKDSRTLIVLFLVVSSTLMISYDPTIFYGMILLSIICFYVVFIKVKFLSKDWKFDKSLYDVPHAEEILVTTKDFYWDGSLKIYHVQNHTSKPNTFFIERGTELKAIHVKEEEDDWILVLKKREELIISVSYLESKKYYKTKSQIREDKLNKLLK